MLYTRKQLKKMNSDWKKAFKKLKKHNAKQVRKYEKQLTAEAELFLAKAAQPPQDVFTDALN